MLFCKKNLLLSFFLFILSFFFYESVFAFSISPLRHTVVVDPGKQAEIILEIENTENSVLEVVSDIDAFLVDSNSGKAVWGQDEGALSWVESQKKELYILPGEKKELSFEVTVPEEAEPGSHYLGLFAKKKIGETEQISQRIGSLLFLYVSGEVQESLVKKHWEYSTHFFKKPQLESQFLFTNSGSIHLVPKGKLEIKRGDRVLKSFSLNEKDIKILPHMDWKKEFVFSDFSWKDFGFFTLSLDFVYGLNEYEFHAEKEFFYISPTLISLVLLILFVFIIMVFIKRKHNNREKI